jgi:hypothetical protein
VTRTDRADLTGAGGVTAWRPSAAAHPIWGVTAVSADDSIGCHLSCFNNQSVKVGGDGVTAFFYFFACARALFFEVVFG